MTTATAHTAPRSWLARPAPAWLVLLNTIGTVVASLMLLALLLLARADGDPCDPEVPVPADQPAPGGLGR